MKIYIAGPMTGIPDFNFSQFHTTAAILRALNHEVINPTELDAGDTTGAWLDYLARDIPLLIRCDTIYMLPGWTTSRGATIEHEIARLFDLRILYHQPVATETRP